MPARGSRAKRQAPYPVRSAKLKRADGKPRCCALKKNSTSRCSRTCTETAEFCTAHAGWPSKIATKSEGYGRHVAPDDESNSDLSGSEDDDKDDKLDDRDQTRQRKPLPFRKPFSYRTLPPRYPSSIPDDDKMVPLGDLSSIINWGERTMPGQVATADDAGASFAVSSWAELGPHSSTDSHLFTNNLETLPTRAVEEEEEEEEEDESEDEEKSEEEDESEESEESSEEEELAKKEKPKKRDIDLFGKPCSDKHGKPKK